MSIVTEGSAIITSERHKEKYEVLKRTPDMVVKNVILGTRRIYWNGECTINCPKNRLSCTLTFKESGSENVVNGTLFYINDQDEEEVIYEIKGKCGGEIYITHPQTKDKKLLIDISGRTQDQIFFPLPPTNDN